MGKDNSSYLAGQINKQKRQGLLRARSPYDDVQAIFHAPLQSNAVVQSKAKKDRDCFGQNAHRKTVQTMFCASLRGNEEKNYELRKEIQSEAKKPQKKPIFKL
jgi:hypothetical protein